MSALMEYGVIFPTSSSVNSLRCSEKNPQLQHFIKVDITLKWKSDRIYITIGNAGRIRNVTPFICGANFNFIKDVHNDLSFG